jgi:hypothetical protein
VRGFIRAANGTFTEFEAPGASKNHPGNGTYAFSINDAGAVCGTYGDSSFHAHGFVRATDGAITGFKARGSGTKGNGQGT